MFYVFDGKASERAGAVARAYYRKREAKDFEKVTSYSEKKTLLIINPVTQKALRDP